MAIYPQRSTLTFPSKQEAFDHMEAMGYRRLPVRGLVRRWAADLCDDDGCALFSVMSSTLQATPAGDYTFTVIDTRPRAARG